MRRLRAYSVVAALFLPFALVFAVHAYTFRQVGITSNILVNESRVHFIQSDGSYTTLDFETGDVVERDMEGRFIPGLDREHYGWRLPSCKLCVVDEEWREERPGIVVEIAAGDTTWHGFLAGYCSARELVTATEADGRILIGTSLGHVECIDLATGRSIWLYHFATVRRTMSCTYPNAMPPGYYEAARIFRRTNARADAYGGVTVLPSPLKPGHDSLEELLERAETPRPRIIRDPRPYNPYRWARAYLTLALTGMMLPLVIGLACLVAMKKRKLQREYVTVAAWSAVALAALTAWFLGWVSITVRSALLFELVAGNVASLGLSFAPRRDRPLWRRLGLPAASLLVALFSYLLVFHC